MVTGVQTCALPIFIRGALPGTYDHVDDSTLTQAVLKNPSVVIGSLRASDPDQYAHVDDDTIAQALVMKLQAPPPPPPQDRSVPAPIAALDAAGAALKEPIDRFMQGVTGNVTGLSNLPAAVMGAPKQIAADVQALRDDPSAALIQFGHRAAGMFGPAAEKLSEGEMPGVGDVMETAGGLYGAEALGGVTSAATKGALKKIITNLPGSAVEKHALAATQMRKMAEDLKPPPALVRTEWDRLQQMGDPVIPMDTLTTRIDDMLAKESIKPPTEQDTEWIARLEGIKSDIQSGPAAAATGRLGWEFEKLKAFHEGLGEEMSTSAQPQAGSPGSRAPMRHNQELSSLMRALNDDVRVNAPGHADQWTRARDLSHKEKSATELMASVNSAIGVTGDARVTAGRLNTLIGRIRQLREGAMGYKDRAALRWVKGFTPTELDALVEKLTEIKQSLPAIPAGKGVPTGSSLAIPRALLGGAIGGTIGGSMGGWEGGRLGMAIGGTVLEGGYRLTQRAMASSGGRAVVRRAVRMDPTRGPFFQHTVATYLRSRAAAEEQRKTEFQKEAMKLEIGQLLDRMRYGTDQQRADLRPVLMIKFLAGGTNPMDRDKLIEQLRPNSNPEVAPAH